MCKGGREKACLPREEVVRQHPPSAAATDDIKNGINDLARLTGTRSATQFDGRQEGGKDRPLTIREVGRIPSSCYHQGTILRILPLLKQAHSLLIMGNRSAP